jgi:colanic acid/amylovoran biosynthesis protein
MPTVTNRQLELNIEVLGIGFPNKGAELMLATVVSRLDKEFPDHYRLVLQSHHPYELRSAYGAYQKYWTEKDGFERGRLAELVPSRLLRGFGIIRDSAIDVVLDCSGFAYGDQWKARKAHRRLGKNVKRWKKQGRKIILMPQAFGPFTNARLKAEMRHIISYADLVFARDRASFEAIKGVAPDAEKIRLSPDMTFGFLPHEEDERPRVERGVAIIPNQKMIAMGVVSLEDYTAALTALVDRLQSENLAPFLLLHEGEKDRSICNDIQSRAKESIELLAPTSPVDIKKIIGECSFVVSSRYHGFVSAISQGVPCAATSWSHKYEILAEEFESPEIIVSVDGGDLVERVLQLIQAPGALTSRRATFERIAAKKRDDVEAMWQRIFQVMKS